MPLYKPGEEPEALAKKVRTFLNKIDEYYPDKQIIGLHNAHKKLGERLTKLYRELGYESGDEMLTAYGYTYVQKRATGDKETRKQELFAELKRRYPEGCGFDSVLVLKEENPDLAGQITSLQIKKPELIAAGILAGTIAPTADDFERLCGEMLEMVQSRYPEGPAWTNQAGLVSAMPEAKQIIADIQTLMQRVIHKPFVEEMRQRGIFARQPAKPEKTLKSGVTREQLEKMYLLGQSERTLTALTRQSFGLPYADYKELRDRTAPKGSVGKALFKLKQLLPLLDQLAGADKHLSEEAIEQEDRNALDSIAKAMDYPDIQTLLAGYGYIVEE